MSRHRMRKVIYGALLDNYISGYFFVDKAGTLNRSFFIPYRIFSKKFHHLCSSPSPSHLHLSQFSMAGDELLKPTIHVEVQLNSPIAKLDEVRREVAAWLIEDYDAVAVGQELHGLDEVLGDSLVGKAEISAYTGRQSSTGFYQLNDVQVDVQAYAFKDQDPRRSIQQASGDDTNYARVLALPNSTLHDEWNSLVFDDGLPARLLRYLVRMIGMMRQPGLNMKTFNWNRLCLLHGPPGSGKSTLCRALAQKVTIRLGGTFANSYLVEINTNAMLSKYFGESGKLIASAFDQITSLAADSDCLVCVVMDEIETIAGLRENATSGNECRDGMRVGLPYFITIQELTNSRLQINY